MLNTTASIDCVGMQLIADLQYDRTSFQAMIIQKENSILIIRKCIIVTVTVTVLFQSLFVYSCTDLG